MKKSTEIYFPLLRSLPGWEQLGSDLHTICAGGGRVSFLCYDITSLRKINRAYGRKVGDALLAAVAEWALGLADGKLYRIEGDEFCLVFKNTDLDTTYQHAACMETRLGKVWQLPVDGATVDVFTQAAIAVLGDLECDIKTELPDLLGQALEIARKTRQIAIFTAESDRMTREHARLQMELKNCILSGMQGFSVVYQPFTDAVSSTWCGLEALCRWVGPTIGPVPPNIFIAEAEEMGLIHQLGTWVLNTALETCQKMGLDRIDRFFVSVNVSALQMNKRDFGRTVKHALERHQYPPHMLVLEITESTQFSFNDITMTTVERLRATGVKFALDDFGSGYSGFSNLKKLPVDILKTDREFIEDIENDSYLQYFYYIMSETAHASGMQLIAEGIETQEQLQSVVKNGADLVQGYLFGRPMEARTIELLKDNFTVPLKEFTGWMTSLADFQQWINSQSAYKITPALFRLQSRCIGIVLEEENTDTTMDKILEMVGIHFRVNRAYVFMQDEGAIFSNRYEWCAEGVEAQKHLFQRVDGEEDGFYDVLRDNEVVIASNVGQLPDNMKERLAAGGQAGSVQSMVAMPMKRRDEILGFVGFDSGTERDWMPEELIILYNLCLLCLIVLARNGHTERDGPT